MSEPQFQKKPGVFASAKAAATRIELSGDGIREDGKNLLGLSSTTDANGATTYNINLGDTWDCGTFTYGGEDVDIEEDVQQPE